MLYLIMGIAVYTLVCVFYMLNRKFKKTTNLKSKIATYFIIVLMILIWLMLPFFTYDNLVVSLLLLVNMIIVRGAQKLYINNVVVQLNIRGREKHIIKPVKVIYTFVYTPLLVLYAFRLHNTFEMILFSIITLIIVYGLIYLLSILAKSKKGGRIVVTILLFIFISPIGLLILNEIPSIETPNLETIVRTVVHKKNTLIYGYSAVNLASIEDGNTNSSVSDFYIDDNYVYYALYNESNYTLKVYDLDQEKIVFEELMLKSGDGNSYFTYEMRNDFFKYEKGNLYCFTTDGIYTLNNLEFTKVSPLTVGYYSQFYLDDELYIYSTVKDQENEIYKISDTITLVDVITDTSVATSVISNKLIIDNGIEISVYGTDETYSYQEGFDKPIFVTDTSALFSLINDDSYMYFYDKYGYVNESGETKIMSTSLIQRYSNSYSINGEYFYKYKDMFSRDRDRVFFDDDFNKLGTYKLDFVTTDYDYGDDPVSKNINDRYIYAVGNDTYKNQEPLFFEVNELMKEETSITIPFSKNISLLSYFLALSIALMPTSFAKKEEEKVI